MEFANKLGEYKNIVNTAKQIIGEKLPDDVKEFEKELAELEANKMLTVAFIGPYSAGKSTIISALTGDQTIKIDADIATDQCAEYTWHDNISLIDTPGIFTDRTDHDEITYAQIKKSDLLVFTLTSNLFDNITLPNFNKIAFDEKQSQKMMIVVNKMMMESGDFNTLVTNYTETLEKNLPTFKEFTPSFIDANLYKEGDAEKDQELKDLSHFEDFISNLNKFIIDNGTWAKLSTPIYKSIAFINASIENITLPEGDEKETLILLRRVEKEVLDIKNKITNECNTHIYNMTSDIVGLSDTISVENEQGTNTQAVAQSKINNIVNETKQKIQNVIEVNAESLENSVKEIMESERGEFVTEAINSNRLNLSEKSLGDISQLQNSFNTPLKDISTFLTPFLSKVPPQLAAGLGTVVALGALYMARLEEDKKIQQRNRVQQKNFSELSSVSDQLAIDIRELVNSYIKENIDSKLDKIQETRQLAISDKTNNDEQVKQLQECNTQLRLLLEYAQQK